MKSCYKSLPDDLTSTVQKKFNDLLTVKQKIHDLKNEIGQYDELIEDKHLNIAAARLEEINIQETNLVESMITDNEKSSYSPLELTSFEDWYSGVQNKIKKIKEFLNANIEYVRKNDPVEILHIRFDTKDVYILYFNEELGKTELYVKSKKFFMGLVKDVEKESKFFVADFDIHPELDKNIGVKIYYYSNGYLIDKDFFTNRIERLKWCLVKSTAVSKVLKKPQAARIIKLPCPGLKTTCSLDKYEWRCNTCEQLVEYGFDNCFYCECGGAPIESYEFKCRNPHEFLALNKPDFESYFERKSKEINILLLGETGVGKSIFINSLLNYLSFSSMEEAVNNELKYAIPAQFFFTDESKALRTINVGSDPNESTNIGQTATQNAKAHVFHIDDMTTLRIIDTPGIFDTRGFEFDKRNFQNTFDYISHYSHLNAIFILLKPNNNQLNFKFKYCIRELLNHLHKNTRENIVFCFTYSQRTYFEAGDTMLILQQLLNDLENESNIKVPLDKNVFYYDNQAFLFLAAVKEGIQFKEKVQKQCSQSWNESVLEIQNLMKYVAHCPIHKIKETVTLNESRRLIMELSRPLAEISRLIQILIQKTETIDGKTRKNQSLMKELNEEQRVIIDTSAKFTHYVQTNSIAVCNYDFDNCLYHLINEEQGKMNAGCNNDSVIDSLIKTSDIYRQQQQKFFNEAIETNFELDEIKRMIQDLYKLKHNGETLKKLVDANKDGFSCNFQFTEQKHDIHSKRTGRVNQLGNQIISFFN